MFKFFLLALMGTLVLSTVTNADIVDRINACEQAGGGACVFDLLRELAAKPAVPAGKTSCFTTAQYTGEICCRITCYEPKIARCYPPSHPSFCRGAVCHCENQ